MILYHGTTKIIKHPDVLFSKNYLDFGKGFYLTSYQKQAEKWAMRKGLRQQLDAIVNVYELSDDLAEYKVLQFDKENEKWLDFVCACRKGEAIYQAYDVIIGAVANDDVFKTVDMYFRGLWDKEKALQELRQAMDIYYHSKLAEQIEQGKYGIENLDYKYLVQDLIENEPQLFNKMTD